MSLYLDLSIEELKQEEHNLRIEYESILDHKLHIDMTRGRPSSEQLNLSMEMLDRFNSDSNYYTENGIDARNYGLLEGTPEARKLFAEYMGIMPEETIITGSSSSVFMCDCLMRAMLTGVLDSEKPWCKYESIKFILQTPGYDKHFKMSNLCGIQVIGVPLEEDGPNIEEIQKIVENDDTVKGIWCVPKYSNPTGLCYSDEKVRKLARLNAKAKDFKIFWDNAYPFHAIYKDVPLLNILNECKLAGYPNRPFIFGSTSKITFPASGISFFGASEDNIKFTLAQTSQYCVNRNKINMLMHTNYFKNIEDIKAHMLKHQAILRPKFDAVLKTLDEEIGDSGAGSWIKPDGGYFITFRTMNGCAKKVEYLCKKAGVIITPAGSTHPYMLDPEDTYLRLAPSLPSMGELESAIHVLCVSAKLASVELLIANKSV